MRNASLAFGFLTRNSNLGELCILHIQKRWETLFRGIVKKYTGDLILRTKFGKIYMKEKLAQNMEIQFHLWNVYSKHKEALVDFFV